MTVISLEQPNRHAAPHEIRFEPQTRVIKRDRLEMFLEFFARVFSGARIAGNERLSLTVAFSGSVESAPGSVVLNDAGVNLVGENFFGDPVPDGCATTCKLTDSAPIGDFSTFGDGQENHTLPER